MWEAELFSGANETLFLQDLSNTMNDSESRVSSHSSKCRISNELRLCKTNHYWRSRMEIEKGIVVVGSSFQSFTATGTIGDSHWTSADAVAKRSSILQNILSVEARMLYNTSIFHKHRVYSIRTLHPDLLLTVGRMGRGNFVGNISLLFARFSHEVLMRDWRAGFN